jgi:uncharacterized protein YjbI with pentapeptide repeats
MKIEIKKMFEDLVLFSFEIEKNNIKITIEKAIKIGINLRGANLRGANLEGANLRNADLSGAYLEGAYLRDANLSYANLRDAYLRDAYLSYANLSYANLSGADLNGAYLNGAYLRGADLEGAKKIPILCKWSFGLTDETIHIGCEERTIQEWDSFFESSEVIQTKRGTKEFIQIEAVYKALRAYKLNLELI